ncbi:MAG: MerR family transcriptional regulator [Propionibacteriaceae bacterium]|nr:MerR family transcriptional regulator [Propionibacteriaceae bacterium]
MAELTGLTPRTLRLWEKVGILFNVRREDNGYRFYTGCDLRDIVLAKRLQAMGFSLKEMREIMDDLRGELDFDELRMRNTDRLWVLHERLKREIEEREIGREMISHHLVNDTLLDISVESSDLFQRTQTVYPEFYNLIPRDWVGSD